MPNRILLIVEGKRTEPSIFGDVFRRYGFNCRISDKKLDVDGIGQFHEYRYNENDRSEVVIVEGPRSRIHGFLKFLSEQPVFLERALSFDVNHFQKIFLLYDVDHNDCDDVIKMSSKFDDESSGMLLLSSPCIEVLGDYNRDREPEKFCHLSEYKKDINAHRNGLTLEYIKDNFESIMLHFLAKNRTDFDEPNIMEHPRLIVDWINRLNERVNLSDEERSYVLYRYYSTVVYVAIASAKSLTKEIDNYELVKSFFESERQKRIGDKEK